MSRILYDVKMKTGHTGCAMQLAVARVPGAIRATDRLIVAVLNTVVSWSTLADNSTTSVHIRAAYTTGATSMNGAHILKQKLNQQEIHLQHFFTRDVHIVC
jgi:hypothetical protein